MNVTTARCAARRLVGRTIVAVDLRPFDAGSDESPRGTTFAPVLTLDDGTRVRFVVDETEGSEYGVTVCVTPLKRGASAKLERDRLAAIVRRARLNNHNDD